MADREGIVYRINGPVIEAKEVTGIFMGDIVEVGEERLIGETIGLDGDTAVIQVYEDTGGLRPGYKCLWYRSAIGGGIRSWIDNKYF